VPHAHLSVAVANQLQGRELRASSAGKLTPVPKNHRHRVGTVSPPRNTAWHAQPAVTATVACARRRIVRRALNPEVECGHPLQLGSRLPPGHNRCARPPGDNPACWLAASLTYNGADACAITGATMDDSATTVLGLASPTTRTPRPATQAVNVPKPLQPSRLAALPIARKGGSSSLRGGWKSTAGPIRYLKATAGGAGCLAVRAR
jgi:hypothetical protein